MEGHSCRAHTDRPRHRTYLHVHDGLCDLRVADEQEAQLVRLALGQLLEVADDVVHLVQAQVRQHRLHRLGRLLLLLLLRGLRRVDIGRDGDAALFGDVLQVAIVGETDSQLPEKARRTSARVLSWS